MIEAVLSDLVRLFCAVTVITASPLPLEGDIENQLPVRVVAQAALAVRETVPEP